MSLVGIIANPASGKDVRRLVSHAITVGNQQKVNVVRRVLLALHACGIERVEIMPDVYGIGERALHALHGRPDVRAMVSIIAICAKQAPVASSAWVVMALLA